jgi:hypothetical protein
MEMKRSTLWMCMVAVVLWAGAGVLAQGQGKGAGGGDKMQPKERTKAPQTAPVPDVTAEKNADKGKAAKQVEETAKQVAKDAKKAAAPKQGGPQDKKTTKETAEKGKGKGQEQQALALQKQLQHEQAKHMERMARLNRIRELAVQKGDAEAIARVDKLIAQEKEVFTRKQQRIQGQPRATAPAGPETAPPTVVGPNDAGSLQGQSAALEEKAGKQAKDAVKETKKADAKAPETPKQ